MYGVAYLAKGKNLKDKSRICVYAINEQHVILY